MSYLSIIFITYIIIMPRGLSQKPGLTMLGNVKAQRKIMVLPQGSYSLRQERKATSRAWEHRGNKRVSMSSSSSGIPAAYPLPKTPSPEVTRTGRAARDYIKNDEIIYPWGIFISNPIAI